MALLHGPSDDYMGESDYSRAKDAERRREAREKELEDINKERPSYTLTREDHERTIAIEMMWVRASLPLIRRMTPMDDEE